MKSLKKYFHSFSTQLGLVMGFLYYISYASPKNGWLDVALIIVSLFIAFFSPYYSRFSNKIDELICFRTASVFFGKLARFSAQYLFNVAIFTILLKGDSVSEESLSLVGGVFGISFLISLTSQGIQYLALGFANRDIGSKNFNVTLSVSINILVGALAAQGFPVAQSASKILGAFFSVIGLLYSLYTDLRGVFSPKGGIGIFFGTFNPVHKTHVKLIRRFIQDCKLDKVIIHPTLIPKVHRIALEKGQIRIKEKTGGMRICETTEKADVHVDYFLTGNKFYEIEHRVNMLRSIANESDLRGIVEIWNMPEAYNKGGFYEIIAEIKRQFCGRRLHGLHGSDVGGMLVRAIYDESFGIIPYSVRRIDNISATAIRKGVKGMTAPEVEEYINHLQTREI